MRWLAILLAIAPLAASAGTITWTNDGGDGWDDGVGENWSAADINAVKTAVDDNDSAITALEARDTIAEHESVETINVILATEIDTSAELRGILTDETGTGAAVFAGGAIGAATATTPSVNDNDTSVATTAFVQSESVAAGDVTGSIGSGLTIGANSVALSTDTTGNYVATIADSGSSEVTVTGSGSEGAAVTLGLAAGITRDSELFPYTVSTADPVDGSDACVNGDMWLNRSGNTIFFCVDGSTDDWWGVNLSDAP